MFKFQWNPWHGCHRYSTGCLNCYVYYLDKLRNNNTTVVTKSKTNFNLPLKKDRNGNFKIPPYSEVAVCLTSDFFIEEADKWRDEVWNIIRKRNDVNFLIPTKRIKRFNECIPYDWGKGYDNVFIAVSCENQDKANERLSIFLEIEAKHKYIFAAPILEDIDFEYFLSSGKIELVSVSGESYENARICNFDWVKHIKETCDKYNTAFDFHQTGSNFMMEGKLYKIKHKDEYTQAKKGMEYIKMNKYK